MASLTHPASLRPLAILSIVGTFVIAAACSSSSSNDVGKAATGGASATTGGSGGASTGGSGGASTGGSGGASTGTGGAPAVPASIQCMANTCAGYVLSLVGAMPPCCINNAACGVMVQGVCAPLAAPGTPDAACMNYPVSAFIPKAPAELRPLPGCCTAQGRCGVELDASLARGPNFGCTDPATLLPGAPAALACGQAGATGSGGAPAAGGAASASGGASSGGAAGAATGGTNSHAGNGGVSGNAG